MNLYIEKEKKKRDIFTRYEKQRKLLKAILRNVNISQDLKHKAFLKLQNLPKDSSIVRFRNRCFLTGRGRFILKSFNLSRLSLRKLITNGMIPGFRKSSW